MFAQIFVWSYTKVGEGPSSNKLYIHTDEDFPGSPPINVTYKNISSVAIRVSWKPPTIPNGIILYYTISFTKGNETQQQIRFVWLS